MKPYEKPWNIVTSLYVCFRSLADSRAGKFVHVVELPTTSKKASQQLQLSIARAQPPPSSTTGTSMDWGALVLSLKNF